MNLFKTSLNKHKTLLVFSAIFLALEALLCLVTPAILGNIISIGIQSKGIDETFPQVLSVNAFSLFEKVLPEEEKEEFTSAFNYYDSNPEWINDKYSTCYSAYYIREDADKKRIEEIFRNGVFSAILIARENENSDEVDYDKLLSMITINALYKAADKVQLNEKDVEKNYSLAEETANAIKIQTASLIMPYLCEDVGIDCESIQNEYIKKQTVIMAICIFFQFVFACASAFTLSSFSSKTENEIRVSLIRRTFRFSKNELSVLPPSYLSSVVTDGVKQIGMSLNFGIRPVIYAIILVIGGSILIFRKSFLFGLLVIICSVLIMTIVIGIYLLTYKRYYKMQDNYEAYAKTIRYNLDQLFTIRTNNAQKFEEKKVGELSASIKKDESFVMKSVLSALSISSLLVNVLTAVVIVSGGKSMLSLNLTIGDIVTYLQYSILIVTAMTMLVAIVLFAPKAMKALKDIDKINSIDVSEDEYSENSQTVHEAAFNISFNNVQLFEGSEKINFTAEQNKITLIKGKTGTGKSLLMDALLREFKPYSGTITIGGTNINEFSCDYPASDLYICRSKPVLFSDTVKNNLLLHGAKNDDDFLLEALKKACCDFLPYDKSALEIFLKNRGELFSGGQRSRISLAAAFAAKSKIYIFDDCLSSLDEKTKKHVLNSINELKKDSVIIIISHSETESLAADKTITLK